mgnify:FL=1
MTALFKLKQFKRRDYASDLLITLPPIQPNNLGE